MANDCLPSIQACAMRVTRLEADGTPDVGASNMYVTAGLITLTATPVWQDGAEMTVANACGDLCLDYQENSRLRRLDVELNICAPDPELSELLSGGTVLTSAGAIGYAYPSLLEDPNPNGVSLELWSKRIDEDGAPDATFPYMWWVLPRVWLRIGAKNFENGPMNNPFSGRAKQNAQWGTGPMDDWPVASTRVLQHLPTADLPDTLCGYQAVPAPTP